MKNDKDQIIETLENLIKARDIVFSQIVNLAMSGEMKEIENVFEIGEEYSFSLSHFKEVKDINVQKLVALCKQMEQTFFTIMDLNGISENEIGNGNDI